VPDCAKRSDDQREATKAAADQDAQSIDLLVELGVSSLKIPSGEITNLPYLRHVGRFGKPVILSTGMATLGEIEAALESPGLSAKSATRGSEPPCA
jgi:sialic acid synthase SpsE